MQDLCVTTISQVPRLSGWMSLRCGYQSVAELYSHPREEAHGGGVSSSRHALSYHSLKL